MEVTIAKTIEIPQVWMEKSSCRQFFGLEERKSYFQSLLTEFRDGEFKDGYMSPTYKVVLVDINKFEAFLKWKEANKFKERRI